jgi:hypothetical protein
MKRLGALVVVLMIFAVLASPAAFAQRDEHGSIGAFFDYVRLGQANDLNQYGIGGRVAFNATSLFAFEAEGAYDFRQSRSLQDITTIPPTTFRADVRTATGLFGPKIHTRGPVRAFATVKGGFVNFSVSTTNAPLGFTDTINGIVDGDTHGALYPGGGIEGFIGWFGLRAEAGDLIYWQNGAHNNIRVTFGPVIRF